MGDTSEYKAEKQIALGILAHVDAGKTTLSESMLHKGGIVKNMGRVDKKNAFLDNYELEKERGITIFSKQAVFRIGNMQVTLLDTPGHIDFSAEMERTLQVLDYAVLVINGADGVQGHTRTLWRLLERYQIPVFLFINKMDQFKGNDEEKQEEQERLLASLQKELSTSCLDFGGEWDAAFLENLALCEEEVLEHYLGHAKEAGFGVLGLTYSPIRGPEGNIEYLGFLQKGATQMETFDLDALVEESHQTLKEHGEGAV